jgi:hypothetical protein
LPLLRPDMSEITKIPPVFFLFFFFFFLQIPKPRFNNRRRFEVKCLNIRVCLLFTSPHRIKPKQTCFTFAESCLTVHSHRAPAMHFLRHRNHVLSLVPILPPPSFLPRFVSKPFNFTSLYRFQLLIFRFFFLLGVGIAENCGSTSLTRFMSSNASSEQGKNTEKVSRMMDL